MELRLTLRDRDRGAPQQRPIENNRPVDREQDSRLREELVERRTVFAGRLLRVHADTVQLTGGHTTSREVVEHAGAVSVVARDDGGRVVMVRQWRHPVGRALWEIPAGTLGGGEAPELAARRELAEETGYGARRWRELGCVPTSPGYSSELMWFYAAEGLEAGQSAPDDDECLEVRLFGPGEIAGLVGGREVDAKTVAGLALAGLSLGGGAGDG